MRGKTVKRIDGLVKDFEVGFDPVEFAKLSNEDKLIKLASKRKLKKRYWNNISCTERSLRSELLKQEEGKE